MRLIYTSTHSTGFRHPNSANQSFALASSVNVRDLGEGVHSARVVYKPFLEPEAIMSGRFEASAHVAHFMENADFANGGQADFGTGMGQLEVYVDDLETPLLITPLNYNLAAVNVALFLSSGYHLARKVRADYM